MMSAGAPERTRTRRILQRSVDVVVATVTLLLTLPVVVLAALAIKLSSPHGPVLVREVRVGREGKRFEMLRLRTTDPVDPVDPVTSATDASSSPPTGETALGGQRVTAVGRILRTCSIDELPQWWNVVRGDMSIVGPPPSAPIGPKQTPDRDRTGGASPGLTGTWRASGRRAPSSSRPD